MDIFKIWFNLFFQQGKKEKGSGQNAGVKEMNPWPDYIQERLDMWDRLKQEQDQTVASKVSQPIKVFIYF